MLTVTTFVGTWSSALVESTSGANFGLMSYNYGWVFVAPKGGTSEKTSYRGSISTGHPNQFGDKACIHTSVDGNILNTGGLITSTVEDVAPASSGYVGPPIYLSVHRLIRPTYTLAVAGILTSEGPEPFHQDFPDHSVGTSVFKDCWLEGEVDGIFCRYVLHYQMLRFGEWIVFDTVRPWYEVDIPNARYRQKGDSHWTAFDNFKQDMDPSPVGVITSGRFFLDLLSRLDRNCPDIDDDEYFSDLVRRCSNDARTLDMNNIENLTELRRLVTDMKATFMLLKGKATVKSVAQLYLNYKYGARLTISDALEIYKVKTRQLKDLEKDYSFTRSMERAVHPCFGPSRAVRSITYNYKIYYRTIDTGLAGFANKLWDVGLFPSLQSSWDLIPLSFVLDWFTEVNKDLDGLDSATYWSTHAVLGALQTKKTVYEGLEVQEVFPYLSDCAGSLSVRSYRRIPTRYIVKPSFFSDSPREFHNYAEAAALIIANR